MHTVFDYGTAAPCVCYACATTVHLESCGERMVDGNGGEPSSIEQSVRGLLLESVALKQRVLQDEALVRAIGASAQLLAECARSGGTIYICCNGGSACYGMHLCE